MIILSLLTAMDSVDLASSSSQASGNVDGSGSSDCSTKSKAKKQKLATSFLPAWKKDRP